MLSLKTRFFDTDYLKNKLLITATKPFFIKALSGQEKDLKMLAKIGKATTTSITQEFFKWLDQAIDNKEALAQLFLNIGRDINSSCKKKLVENLIFNQFVQGSQKREELMRSGTYAPQLLVISPTMRCNLTCTGCYAGKYQKSDDLPEETIDDILKQAKELGVYFIVVSGGEPYLKKEMWFRLWEKYNDMYFLTFTNGTFIDEETAKKLGELGNIIPAISVEGFEAETDQRRGAGVHQKILKAMANLKKEGVLFGFSATATKHNWETISSDEFAEYYLDKGIKFGWYFLFMPVGKDPDLDLMATPQQRYELGKRVKKLRAKYPFFAADFWNDGPAVGGCMAGRLYMHILYNGNVEPCVFTHFAIDNVREKSLKDIFSSDFFKFFRKKHPYNDSKNLLMPCSIIDNPEILREAVEKFGAFSSHQDSESIVVDPSVIEFVNDYAKELKEITEPIWEKEYLNNPESMWHKDGELYQKTFIKDKENI